MSELNGSTINSDKNVEESRKNIREDNGESFIKTRAKIAKEAFLEWSSRTDMNIYGKIFEYKGNIWAQIIWIIIFLVLSGLTVVLIQQSISAYLSYSVTSTYETIYESPTEFPTITICAGSPFTSLQAKKLFQELISSYSFDSSKLSKLIEMAKMHASNPSYGDENRKKLGFSINDITSCLFDKVDCKNDLHWIWLYDFGNCLQFNSGLNFSNQKIDFVKSSRLDKGYGLRLTIGVSRLYSLDIGNSTFRFYINDFVAFIHNSSNLISSSTKLSYIQNLFRTAMSLKRTLISKQPSPYSDCIELSSYSSVLYDYLLQSNYSYRQIDCLDLCIQKKIISACGCYYLKYPSLNTQRMPCLNWTQFLCANEEINNFERADCIKTYCPLECTLIEYQLEYSIGDVFDESFVNGYIPTMITASYSTLQYTQVTESPQTTFINLLTQLGGSLGIFISFSVFTFFETLEVFVLVLYALCFRACQNTRVNQNDQNIANVLKK